ncbi:GYD domain-containing protein [Haloferax namakaokahaiae]|uniref:GYD domain-containing protein n=1 Tax=Haloferax namakaokahaiae TaxID=1748331 RepID=A0ABD5ZID3_9EURY
MPTYITLYNYTQEGIEHIDESPDRLDGFIDLVESMGGELIEYYLTMGEYDVITITEFPDDDAAAKALLRNAQAGAGTAQTLKAWPEADYRELIANLP